MVYPGGVGGVHTRVVYTYHTQEGIYTRVYTPGRAYTPGYTHPGRLLYTSLPPREVYLPPLGYPPGRHNPGRCTPLHTQGGITRVGAPLTHTGRHNPGMGHLTHTGRHNPGI